MGDRQPISVQAAQVRLTLDAYGLDQAARVQFVDAMIERQTRNVQFWEHRRRAGCVTPFNKIGTIIDWSIHERSFTEANRATLTAVVSRS